MEDNAKIEDIIVSSISNKVTKKDKDTKCKLRGKDSMDKADNQLLPNNIRAKKKIAKNKNIHNITSNKNNKSLKKRYSKSSKLMEKINNIKRNIDAMNTDVCICCCEYVYNTLPCGHKIHLNCICNSGKLECPICRTKLEEDMFSDEQLLFYEKNRDELKEYIKKAELSLTEDLLETEFDDAIGGEISDILLYNILSIMTNNNIAECAFNIDDITNEIGNLNDIIYSIK